MIISKKYYEPILKIIYSASSLLIISSISVATLMLQKWDTFVMSLLKVSFGGFIEPLAHASNVLNPPKQYAKLLSSM